VTDAQSAAQRVVEEATPLLQRLLTTVTIGVVIADMRATDTPLVYVNPAFERLSGYSAQETIGRNCRFLQGPDTDPGAVAEIREALIEGTAVTTTLRNYRRDGSPFWNEIRLAPVPDEDGSIKFYIGLLTDVSDRLRAESELARANALHTSVFNVMAEGTMVIAADGTVLDVNPAALSILRHPRDELHGDWWTRLRARYPDGTAVTPAGSPGTTAARERRGVHGTRLIVRRGDGVDRLISINYEPLIGEAPNDSAGVVISFRDITDFQRREEEYQRFAALVAISDDFVALADLDGAVQYVNEAGRRLVGLGRDDDVTGYTIWDFFSERGRELSRAVATPAVLGEGRWRGESGLRHFRTGQEIPVRVSSFLVHHPETGEPWARATIQHDISEEQRVMADLRRSQERYQAQFQSLPVPTYLWQRRGDDFVLLECNQAAEVLTHGAVKNLIGLTGAEMYPDDPEIRLHLERCWSTQTPITEEMDYQLRSIGGVRHMVVTYVPVPPDYLLVHTLDITERVASERELRRLTERDDLTGLFNRRYFEQRLREALGSRSAAVIIIDVDHFKFVNDALGHQQGDDLLREVSEAMRAGLRDHDVLARFGGDEFALLLADADDDHARTVAHHVLGAIRSRVTGVSVTASAGVAVFAAGAAVSPSDAVVAADIALYEAKQTGRDRVALYSGQAGHSLTWLQQIRSAISEDRLVLHAQPIIALGSETAVPMFELLVRMSDEQGSLIPPSSFLPTAEQFGLIRDIDRWVLERGLEIAARGHHVSLNLSARTLADPDLADRVAGEIARTGARPEHVTFEFTETAAVSSVEDARALTEALRALGCGVALDDFGTGFGTFVLLKHLPVSALKIDSEFVRGLSSSPADQRIVRAIVQIAAAAGIATVAEGVEDAGALALLREYGVGYAQGYHIAHPGPLPNS
jgi:diguanylate cyclase (GGDEF)-like protein/PAS domain S-box-containing protein